MTNRISRSALVAGARNPVTMESPDVLYEYQEQPRVMAIRLLSITLFLLVSIPLLNIKIGSIPFYAIDFFIFLTWVYASQLKFPQNLPHKGLVAFILLAAILSEFLAGLRIGTLLQPIYLIVRTTLAISLFFLVPVIVKSKNDLTPILKAILLGTLITSSLTIASSLPQTKGIVASYIFSNTFLYPSGEGFSRAFLYSSTAMRGQSLVGTPILSAAFINSLWPLTFLLRNDKTLSFKWSIAIWAVLLLAPLGVVMTYSRGAIAGLAGVVSIALLFNSGKARQSVVISVGIMFLFFSWVGWESEALKFEWLQEKTTYQFENLNKSYDMTSRIYSYVDPFRVIAEKPFFFLLGQGFARFKVAGAGVEVGGAGHSVFGTATYGYGMSAAFNYIFLLIASLLLSWINVWRSKDAFTNTYSSTILSSLLGISSWFILGSAAVSEPRGAALLFMILGLVAVQVNFSSSPDAVTITKPPITEGNMRKQLTRKNTGVAVQRK